MGLAPSDTGLILRSQREPAAFGEIFERHCDSVHGFIARRLGWQAAEDLTSEVFLTAFRRRDSFDPDSSGALPWLYGIAHNLMARHLRGAGRGARAHLRLVGATAPEVDNTEPVADALEAADLIARLPVGFASLSREDRDTLLLHCWEGLSYQDIGSALEIPVGTVKSRINRARRQLREHLWPEAPSEPGGRRGRGRA